MTMEKKIKIGLTGLLIVTISLIAWYFISSNYIPCCGKVPLPLGECCIDYFILEQNALDIHEFQLNAPDPSCREVFTNEFGTIDHSTILRECCLSDLDVWDTPKAISEQKVQFRKDISMECSGEGWFLFREEEAKKRWSKTIVDGKCIFKLCSDEDPFTLKPQNQTDIFSKEFKIR